MSREKVQVKSETQITQDVEMKVVEGTALAVDQTPEQPMVQSGPDWSKIERLDHNSLQARWYFEKYSVIRELWRAHCQMVTFYMKPEGGNFSLEEAIKLASEELGEGTMLEDKIQDLLGGNVKSLSWYTLNRVFLTNPSYAQQLWEEVKEQALLDFKSGHFAAALFEHTDWQKDVWKRAHFAAIFQEMVEEYNPRGAIEMSMVEMVAVHYFLWQHWVGEHLKRATTEPRRESADYKEWRSDRKRMYMRNGTLVKGEYSGQYFEGAWDLPYQNEADAIQHALEMADRCRRAYHAAVRALRDWRRYSVPVTINNPQQVNIAADGGQQVNVQNKEKSNRRNKRLKLIEQ